MVILQMSGGLGNQMFQYATALRLLAEGRDVAIDDETAYREMGKAARKKMLEEAFGITYKKADQRDVTAFLDASMDPRDRIRRKIRGRRSREVKDEDFVYDEELLEKDNVYLTGCFQCPAYFAPVEEKVRAAFTFREDIERTHEEVKRDAERIREQEESCSIHLRFGDYLEKSETYGGITTDAYYDAAIREIGSRHPGTVFFVFSNDAERAAEWIQRAKKRTGADFVLPSPHDEDHGYLDLYLMTLTGDHVIANSSFSFWGAFLGKKEGSITAAPSIWIHEKDGSVPKRRDIYTKDMMLISPRGEIPEKLLSSSPADPPLVSVITACYNIAPYVRRAIGSLCCQTLKNIEIIAVDDGSTDETGRILDELAGKDARIRVIHKENGGLSDCRNAGLRIARGRYIGFLDGDDFADPRMYETMAGGCLVTGAGMAAIRYLPVYENEPAPEAEPGKSPGALFREAELLTGDGAMDLWIASSLKGPEEKPFIANSVWSKLFRRDILEGITFEKGKNSEDILFTTRTILRTDALLAIPAPLYCYLEDRKGSIMNKKTGQRRVSDEIPFWEEQIRLLREAGKKTLAGKAQFSLARRLLYYITEMRQDPALSSYARTLWEKLLGMKDEVLPLAGDPAFGSSGDRLRVRMVLRCPKLYFYLDGLRSRRNRS